MSKVYITKNLINFKWLVIELEKAFQEVDK